MKTLMVLGVHDEGYPYARAIRRESYRVIAGSERQLRPVRPAESHVLVESTNTGEVLRLARRYGVDGILGVGDAGTLAASYVAQQLGLAGMPYAEEQLFHNLLRLRAFQVQHGFQVPRYKDLTHSLDTGDLHYPLYVSPADGQVLRHTERVEGPAQLAAARYRARRHSKEGLVIAQEELPGVSDGAALVVMTELVVRSGALQPVIWCEALSVGLRNRYVPHCARYPARFPERTGPILQMMLEGECARLVSLLQLQDAHIPVLAYCVPGGVPYLIRVGLRDGAYNTTRFLSHLYRRDLLREAVRLAAGDLLSTRRFRLPAEGTFCAYYTITASQAGILRHIHFADELRPYRKGFVRSARQSERIYLDGTEEQTLGTQVLEFPDEATMEDVMGRIRSLITVEMDELGERW